jgi:thiol-disulfide isomerase/thioredoxin
MKKVYFLLILTILFITGCGTTKPVAEIKSQPAPAIVTAPGNAVQTVDFSKESTFLLGFFNLQRLTEEPYSEWYVKGYDDYQINTEAINRLLDISKDNLKIKVIMGTWCPDSRREVPKFVRVLDICRIPLDQVTFIGVDKAKKSAIAGYESLKIEKVPTFILYKNNIEAGRIIEIIII